MFHHGNISMVSHAYISIVPEDIF